MLQALPLMLISLYMCVKDHNTRVNQCEYSSVNQAGGHRGIIAVWRGDTGHVRTHKLL